MTHQIDDWTNCYDLGWQKTIHPAAYSHPAKFSRGLITRIIRHALDSGYIRPGAVVVDPFGGQAGGALPCMENGLHWVGIELESKFCEVGQGSDCTGISKENWIRFYSRWEKSSSVDGLHFCPDCLAEAGRIIGEVKDKPRSQAQAYRRKRIAFLAKKHNRPLRLYPASPLPGTRAEIQKAFTTVDSGGSYRRNSGQIPSTGAHRFNGNIERWEKMFPHLPGSAVLLQGDSRRLSEVVAGAGLVVGSPPYAEAMGHGGQTEIDNEKRLWTRREFYGTTPGQLGAMKSGDIDAIIASPPFAGNTGGRGEASRNGIDAALFDRHSGGMKKGTGDDPANLDHLPMGDIQAVIGSPPYAEQPTRNGGGLSENSWNDGKARRIGASQNCNPGYGQTPGQLGAMKAGELAAVGSPPYENQNACNDPKYQNGRINGGGPLFSDYGSTDGRLGRDSGETFWSAARLIVEQCAAILPPGAVAIWIVKRYVKVGKIVDFPGQWRQLCEACGFRLEHHHRAWLVKNQGIEQIGIDGDTTGKSVKRVSFFRRLHEKKRPDLAIDWEDVMCFVKV